MSGAVVTLQGIRVRVVPDDASAAACADCVFRGASVNCPLAGEERAAGIEPCYHAEGHHYVKEEEDAHA